MAETPEQPIATATTEVPTPVETTTPSVETSVTGTVTPNATPSETVTSATVEPSKHHWWQFWKPSTTESSVPPQPDMSQELRPTAAQPEQLIDSPVKVPTETPTPSANIPDTKAA